MKELEFQDLLPLLKSISDLYYLSVSYKWTVVDTKSNEFYEGGSTGLFLDLTEKLNDAMISRSAVSRVMLQHEEPK